MDDAKDIPCNQTKMLLKYGYENGYRIKDLLNKIGIPYEVLTNPEEWTTATVWTQLAINLQNLILQNNPKSTLHQTVQEILFKDNTSYMLDFILKRMPEHLVTSNLTKYVCTYSNKNLLMSAVMIRDGFAIVKSRPIKKENYSSQMCEFNHGWIVSYLKYRGYENVSVVERSCCMEDRDEPDCVYVATWKSNHNVLCKLLNSIVNKARNQKPIIKLLESYYFGSHNKHRGLDDVRLSSYKMDREKIETIKILVSKDKFSEDGETINMIRDLLK